MVNMSHSWLELAVSSLKSTDRVCSPCVQNSITQKWLMQSVVCRYRERPLAKSTRVESGSPSAPIASFERIES